MRLIAALLLAGVAGPLAAQTTAPAPAETPAFKPFVAADGKAAAAAAAAVLDSDFVFPEVGKRYAETLRSKLADGAYDTFADSGAFARAVTSDLQAVHADKHLRLFAPRAESAGEPGPRPRRGPGEESAITRSGWLAPGVAYVDFAGFPGNAATMDAVRRFLADYKDAKTLIIDAREHRGGGLSEMDALFPALFSKPTVLVGMDTRVAVDQRAGAPEEWRLRQVNGPEGVVRREHYVEPAGAPSALAKAKVYLLTSNRTGSAGEHLSLSLKRTGRATLVGETTRGMGHYGGVRDLGGGYELFVPVGRTFDPDNGQGWEGVGVTPNVAVPADQALAKALELAGVKADAKVALANLR